MHEITRQEYLSALGIDIYIPRWKIDFAAESQLYEQTFDSQPELIHANNDIDTQQSESPVIDLRQMLESVVERVSVKKEIQTALQQQGEKNLQAIQSFSLSVWRPVSGFLIVSARNTNAMPTELILNNFLRFYLNQNQLTLHEEVLRWPSVENQKITLTNLDACAELQTWLSVQHEFQPIKNLWLFGDISHYFMPDKSIDFDVFVKKFEINLDQNGSSAGPVAVKIFPDLTQFLLQPELKAQLLSLV